MMSDSPIKVGKMKEKSDVSPEPTPEQILYAAVLEKGMYVGLACLFITFAIYVFGVMDPHIPLDEVSKYWELKVGDYLHEAEIEPGWAWVSMLGYGDFINFIGITILAGVSVFCYIAIIPLLLKKKDTIYAVLALLEVIVLVAAASGIIAAGH